MMAVFPTASKLIIVHIETANLWQHHHGHRAPPSSESWAWQRHGVPIGDAESSPENNPGSVGCTDIV